MPKLRIEYSKKTCIGNKACLAMDPKRWKDIGEKVDLINGKEISRDLFILEGNYSEEESETIIEGAKVCPVNAIGIIDLIANKEIVSREVKTDKMEEVIASYNDAKEFVLDPRGYFLIRINKQTKEIEIGFCKEKNIVLRKITGKTPIEVYQTAIKLGLISRLDHAAYLGRELQKAYIALQQNLDYIQDDELNFK